MSERSEPKLVCRRNALTFLGYAAVFGLVASPAILAVSRGGSPDHHGTRHAHDAARRRAEVWDRAAVRSGEADEQNGARNTTRTHRAAPAERRTGRDERRDEHHTCSRHHRAGDVIV